MSTRRSLLKTLGVTVLTAGGLTRSSHASDKPLPGEGILKFFPNVAALILGKKLKEGDVIKTLGYHQINDGGHAEYLISNKQDRYETGVALKNGLFALLINVSAINYKMFGTVSDGLHDDGIEIGKAHKYANEKKLPVFNYTGEFWLKKSSSIEILNNVEWGNTVFHIDEQFNSPKAYKFIIVSSKEKVKRSFSPQEKANIINKLKPGVNIIEEFSAFSGHLVYIEDTNDRIGFRAGSRYNGQSSAKQELVYIEEHGKVLGEVAYTFRDFSSIELIPVDDTYLTVNGGCFCLSGDSDGKGYTKNGFGVLRSRTLISNQVVRLEAGKKDIAPNARTGFYNFSKVYEVKLENIRLIPYEQDREGTANDVPAGTYGISGGKMLNATFRNVTAEGSAVHWGVFGTNMNKNFKIDGCHLNRVDVHFHCWNLSILNSKIGYRGISITGGGDLTIQNSTCESRSFINFRRDFGARWDGDIRISNCKFIPAASSTNSMLDFNPANFDYKYPIVFGKSISVENLVIDYTNSKAQGSLYLMSLCDFSEMDYGERIVFPKSVQLKNIIVHGQKRGVRIVTLYNPKGYYVEAEGSCDEIELKHNCKILVDNVALEDFSGQKASENNNHILIKGGSQDSKDSHSLFLQVEIANCPSVTMDVSGVPAKVIIRNSNLSAFKSKGFGTMKGEIYLSECRILPEVLTKEEVKVELDTTLGTVFSNCTIHSPKISGKFEPSITSSYGFIKINEKLNFNHSNTMLGKDILNYLKAKGVSLTSKFINNLKSHSDLED